MKTTTVLFDLGNTLVSYYKASEFMPVLKSCVENCCDYLSLNGKEFLEDEAFRKACDLNYEREDLAIWGIDERLHRIFGAGHNEDELQKIFMEPIFDTARLDQKAVPLLKGLRERGIKTGIVSNTPWGSPASLWKDELNRHGLLDLVDEAIFCVDVGWRKPHTAIFSHALNRLEANANETVFVGDDPKWDVYGAQQSGIKPVLISPDLEKNQNYVIIRSLDELYGYI